MRADGICSGVYSAAGVTIVILLEQMRKEMCCA
jgi:hypothetical protein